MSKKMNRRSFFKLAGLAAGATVAAPRIGSNEELQSARNGSTSFIPNGQETDTPTYEADIVGEIQRYDQRHNMFARVDIRKLGPENPDYQALYAEHPEWEAVDEEIVNMPPLGQGGKYDNAMVGALFGYGTRAGVENMVDGEPAPDQVPLPPDVAAQKVKAFARILGADIVGIAALRPEWVYSHVGRTFGEGFNPRGEEIDLSDHTNVIAFGIHMDRELLKTAPDFPEMVATGQGYYKVSWASVVLAQYIRLLGYQARAHHFRNEQVLLVPCAIDCGLGELSRAGFLITKELGLGLRLAAVTTNMPLEHDKPIDIGVQSFCTTCKICAEECPSGSIPMGEKTEHNGIMRWKTNAETCYKYWFEASSDCQICMASCPWTQQSNWLHNTMVDLAAIEGPHQTLMTQADKIFYGRYQPAPRPDFIVPAED